MSNSIRSYQLISDRNSNTAFLEAYKALRTNIEFSKSHDSIQAIMVTSTQISEGKSAVSANLAISYAQSSRKVLLIDADMRKPAQHDIFQVRNDVGVSTLLNGQDEMENVIADTMFNYLSLIPAGPISEYACEMLATKRMSTLLSDAKRHYDIIIIDTPPILSVSDAQIVATYCDGVLLVVDSGKVKKEFVVQAKASLELVKANIVGVVLNNMDPKLINRDYSYSLHS